MFGRRCFGNAFCVLLVAVGSASAPQVRHVLGTVRAVDDQPVGHADVDIDGTDLGVATDKGAFTLDVPPFRVGFPYTFHVTGWVVVDPCVLARGRLYLPDPDAEKVPLEVARPGDSRLLSGKSIGCLFEGKASRYELKQDEGAGAGPRSELASARPAIFAQRFTPRAPALVEGGRGQVRLVRVRYLPTLLALSAPIQAEGGKGIGDDSLVQQAKELGFTAEQLRSAINGWRATMTDPYQRGLAALDSGRYTEASTYIAESIESSKGPLERYVPLGRAEYELGHYQAAESDLRRVLAVHGDDPLILNDLGIVLLAEAKYSEAEPLLKRALAIGEKALGPEHPDVAMGLHNLAGLYYEQGKYAEAEPLYRRAMAIGEKALGPEHLAVAGNLNSLAQLYVQEGRYAEAEPLYQRALAIDEKALGGPGNEAVARDLNYLGELYDNVGKYAEAEPLYQRALDIAEMTWGLHHPHVATCLNFLGRLYVQEGRYAEAEPLLKRALAIDEKALGPEHPDVASCLDSQAQLYYQRGEYAEAEPLMKRALAIDEKALGPNHPYVATDLHNLAQLYVQEGRYAEAEQVMKRALAFDERALGPEHPNVAGGLNSLAQLYFQQGKYAEAEPLLRRALAIDEKALGPDHPHVADMAWGMAMLLRRLGREGEAKVYEDQAARIRAKTNHQH